MALCTVKALVVIFTRQWHSIVKVQVEYVKFGFEYVDLLILLNKVEWKGADLGVEESTEKKAFVLFDWLWLLCRAEFYMEYVQKKPLEALEFHFETRLGIPSYLQLSASWNLHCNLLSLISPWT